MHDLAWLAAMEVKAALVLLYGAIAVLLLTGGIRLTGLLHSKPDGAFDPARLQTLIITFLVAAALLSNIGEMQSSNQIGLPSEWLLALLGGSHGIYLGRKLRQTGVFRNGGNA